MDLLNSISNAVNSVVSDVEDGVGKGLSVLDAPVGLIQEGCQKVYQGLVCGGEDVFNVLKGGGGLLLNEVEGFPGGLWEDAKLGVGALIDWL